MLYICTSKANELLHNSTEDTPVKTLIYSSERDELTALMVAKLYNVLITNTS